MEGTIIWETIKAVVIFCAIFDSDPFRKVSNSILLRCQFPRVINHLLECNYCIGFWVSIPFSIALQTTSITFISIITILLWNKINK